jgi:hypothetical protein
MTTNSVRPKRKILKPRSNPSSLNSACREIYLGFPDKSFRTYIAPLLRFAHDRGIDPWAIDDHVIEDFKAALVDYGVVDPNAFISPLIRDWNRLRGHSAFAALKLLKPVTGKRASVRATRQQLISAAVWQELNQIHGGRLKSRNSSEHAAYNQRKRLERLVEVAAVGGAAIAQLAELADLVVLRQAINRLYPNTKAPSKPRDILLSELERFFRKASQPLQAEIVEDVRRSFPLAGIGLAPGSAAMVVTFSQDDMIAIASSAIAIVNRLEPGSSGRKAIAHARAAIAILLVLFNTCPRGTLEAATFSGKRPDRPRPALLGPHGNAEHLDLEANLPPAATAALDHYYGSLTSWLGRTPQTLFDVPNGESARSGSALSTGVRRLLEDFGYPGFTLQLLRDGVNAFFLRARKAKELAAANGYAFEANFQHRYKALDGSDIAGQIEASFGRYTGASAERVP